MSSIIEALDIRHIRRLVIEAQGHELQATSLYMIYLSSLYLSRYWNPLERGSKAGCKKCSAVVRSTSVDAFGPKLLDLYLGDASPFVYRTS